MYNRFFLRKFFINKLIIYISIFIFLLFKNQAYTQTTKSPIDLESYLTEVSINNATISGLKSKRDSIKNRMREVELLFSPSFFLTSQTGKDSSYPQPGITYSAIETQSLQVGLMNQFDFGLQSKLYLNGQKTNFINGGFAGNRFIWNYWDTRPIIELSLPLIRNRLGYASRQTRNTQKKQLETDFYTNETELSAQLLGAEISYWSLAASLELLMIQEKSFNRAMETYHFIVKQAASHLRDDIDVKQIKAAMEAANLRLKRAKDEVQIASIDFNIKRAMHPTEGPISLKSIIWDKIVWNSLPEKRPGDRADFLLNIAIHELSGAQLNIAIDNNRPTLEAFGSFALSGRNQNLLNSTSDAWSSRRQASAFGIRLVVPLNFGAIDASTSGLMVQKIVDQKNLEQRRYDQDSEWYLLLQKTVHAHRQYQMDLEIEKAENEKLILSKNLFKKGRFSLINVLQFEQDYLRAQASRTRSALELLLLGAQAKIYINPTSINTKVETKE